MPTREDIERDKAILSRAYEEAFDKVEELLSLVLTMRSEVISEDCTSMYEYFYWLGYELEDLKGMIETIGE